MNDRPKLPTDPDHHATDPPRDLGERLLEEYGPDLETDDLSEDQQKEFLLALWQIMQAFVDLGFSIAPGSDFAGDNKDASGAPGFDDVLQCLTLESHPHETVASEKFNQSNKKEH